MNVRLLLVFGTLTFAALTGFHIASFLAGFLFTALVIWIYPQLPPLGEAFRSKGRLLARAVRFTFNCLHFTVHFLYDLTVSNLVLARDIWTPIDIYTPRMVEVPVGDLGRFEVAFLAARITLTPGTLSVAVCPERLVLIVHAMYPGGEDYAWQLRRPIDILRKGLVD